MTPAEQIERERAAWRRIGAESPWLVESLTRDWQDAVKYLTDAPDPVAIHRSQGKARFINDLLTRLVGNK